MGNSNWIILIQSPIKLHSLELAKRRDCCWWRYNKLCLILDDDETTALCTTDIHGGPYEWGSVFHDTKTHIKFEFPEPKTATKVYLRSTDTGWWYGWLQIADLKINYETDIQGIDLESLSFSQKVIILS